MKPSFPGFISEKSSGGEYKHMVIKWSAEAQFRIGCFCLTCNPLIVSVSKLSHHETQCCHISFFKLQGVATRAVCRSDSAPYSGSSIHQCVMQCGAHSGGRWDHPAGRTAPFRTMLINLIIILTIMHAAYNGCQPTGARGRLASNYVDGCMHERRQRIRAPIPSNCPAASISTF